MCTSPFLSTTNYSWEHHYTARVGINKLFNSATCQCTVHPPNNLSAASLMSEPLATIKRNDWDNGESYVWPSQISNMAAARPDVNSWINPFVQHNADQSRGHSTGGRCHDGTAYL